jgi:hypothetical protein
MNFQQIEKVTKLIQTSPILSTQERGEWLLLLDLMNDKQMFELEKILSSGRPAPVQTSQIRPASDQMRKAPEASPKPAMPLQTPKANISNTLRQEVSNFKNIPPVHKNPPQPLHLSHIMNLPRVEETKGQQAVKKPVVQVADEKKGFLQKLKNALSEKELPPGGLENEKELPPPLKISKPLAPLVPKPPVKSAVSAPLKDEKVNESKRLAEFLAKSKFSNLTVVRPLTPAGASPEKAEIKNIKPQFKQAIPEKPKIEPQIAPLQKISLADQIASSRPISYAEPASSQNQTARVQTGVKLENISWGKLTDKAKKEPQAESIGKEIVLNDFQKIASLSAGSLDEFSSRSIIAQIKKFIKTLGYHEVVFNIEKSPLYKAYIEAGVDVLDNKGNFENAGKPNLPLTRQQFEKFTDILRQIQTG